MLFSDFTVCVFVLVLLLLVYFGIWHFVFGYFGVILVCSCVLLLFCCTWLLPVILLWFAGFCCYFGVVWITSVGLVFLVFMVRGLVCVLW